MARVHREIADSGPPPGLVHLSEADYDGLTDALLAQHDGGDLWIFAYGSLIWRPACEIDGQLHARLVGWHRAFCLKLWRFRGTEDCPGLMMALDRGGETEGVVQRFPAAFARERLGQLLRREVVVKPSTNSPRWVTVEVEGAARPAIAFYADPAGPSYVGGLAEDEVAATLARACGHGGSGAEYLLNTVAHLERLGIHDPYLWSLQEKVAAVIRAATSPATEPPV